MDDTIATELLIRRKETERKSQITKIETKFQTALKEFQNEKIKSEKLLDTSESKITVAEVHSTEPSTIISESNGTNLDLTRTEKKASVSNDSVIRNDKTNTTNEKPFGQTAEMAKKVQTPNLAKILDIKKMIYQLAGDQKITDEYLIEIIYSKVKSSSKPFTYSFVLTIYLYI